MTSTLSLESGIFDDVGEAGVSVSFTWSNCWFSREWISLFSFINLSILKVSNKWHSIALRVTPRRFVILRDETPFAPIYRWVIRCASHTRHFDSSSQTEETSPWYVLRVYTNSTGPITGTGVARRDSCSRLGVSARALRTRCIPTKSLLHNQD